MGWTDRDWAKWTPEERRRFYGGGSFSSPPDAPLPLFGEPRRPRASWLTRRVGRRDVLCALVVVLAVLGWKLYADYGVRVNVTRNPLNVTMPPVSRPAVPMRRIRPAPCVQM